MIAGAGVTEPSSLLDKISRWEPYTLPSCLRWSLAVLAWAVALVVRYELEGALPTGFPYLTFFPAILISAYFLGPAQGIFVAIASGVASWYFFIPPLNSFAFSGATAVALMFYAFVAAVEIGLTTLAQRARRALSVEREAKEVLAAIVEIAASVILEDEAVDDNGRAGFFRVFADAGADFRNRDERLAIRREIEVGDAALYVADFPGCS